MAIFESTLKPKLIYVFAISDGNHEGILKIGETTLQDYSNPMPAPNSKELNKAAKIRIDGYTRTAGIKYQLLYTESALFIDAANGTFSSFNDKQVHHVLERSGVKKKEDDSFGSEWFYTDLETVKNAIQAVKEGRTSLSANQVTQGQNPIIFRPEQRDAIDKTLNKFKHGNRMLWNAKMRFGKTLSALQVVKEMELTRTLILTHRPTVDEGWYEDFKKIFYDNGMYDYGSKTHGNRLDTMELSANMGIMKYVYFASMQDLRGSNRVGGKFNKNDAVFSTPWDMIIVDEAHEGTQTQLGQNVMAELTKPTTKVLQLSGTPFNLLESFEEDEVYTWDYTMEQTAKMRWDEEHFGDPNPYAGLPTMNIYTYDLGNLMGFGDEHDVAFNFTEFLRVKEDGTFVHAQDVERFLNLLTKEDKESCYPFANQEYRNNFKHTLWMVPGVKAAAAMSAMLKRHPVFGSFGIVNVAGEGDEEIDTTHALAEVKKAIAENEYTITLSCGRLTTGVSVPQWTAVLMISGAFNTAASSYMQTIFRVQTPWTHEGKTKEQCYVFDFAPDRTLKVIADTVKVSTKAGKTTGDDRKRMGDFLNFCPIISFEGSKMQEKMTADRLFTQLKKIYVERVVSSGFEDNSLYSDELMKMDTLQLDDFKELKGIIGTTKAMPKTGDIDMNNQGLNKEEYDRKEELEKKKRKRELSPEEQKELDRLNEAKKNRSAAISILRGISIRMPLLIYGAELDEDEDITITNFARKIDDNSWNEFMPAGVTKLIFSNFRKYYDQDIFMEAGRRIRSLAKAADEMSVEERIERITSIFDNFRNPDKETVLTPWRVVNMHMGDCLGGYNFYDEKYAQKLDEPRYIERGEVTESVFNANSRILEINSKSGLYPLYVAYSVYRAKVRASLVSIETVEQQQQVWDTVLRDNIFVICKTKMAQSITRRTLCGFRKGVKTNTHAFDDLINQITNKQAELIEKINKGQLFKNFKNMKFNAIVGNPPYQQMDGGGAGYSSIPVYHNFVNVSKSLKPNYISLITPARWFAGGKGLDDFRDKMLNDKCISTIVDFAESRELFPTADIAGGICYFLWNSKHTGLCDVVSVSQNTRQINVRSLNEFDTFIRQYEAVGIVRKVMESREKTMDEMVYSRKPYGIDNGYIGQYKPFPNCIKLFGSQGITYINKFEIKQNENTVTDWKVIASKASAQGGRTDKEGRRKVIPKIEILEPGSVCTESYLLISHFNSEIQAINLSTYMKTKFLRFLLSLKVITQNIAKDCFSFIPIQDFSKPWTDAELYKKYNLTPEEIAYIEKMIKPMGADENDEEAAEQPKKREKKKKDGQYRLI